ncbi:MAG: asparaginase [Alkalibacterium sp.]|nr:MULTISPECIES: asparaginase [Alkalibacterium]MDN6193591.1 asparaginase [Alkalibacterium sp.]MDN6293723.1 asparaginase [Alkalibacterium sp.]MDN6295433.1 asparaginase [Alkalibacterium sp.]MDN6326588.1 asparaginase [Alkalibacterium sp.]MDN6398014.1 asparaginase [Alkalibacterium sp.]
MKRILLLHTGGTISMSTDQSTGAVKPSNEHPLHKYSQLFDENIEIIEEDILELPSPHITLLHMLSIQKRLNTAIDEDHYDGAVITHGTDTLEETAYFLDLTLDSPFPIVLTGAMRPIDEIGSDGVRNLQSAIWTALSEEAINKGILVVMNEEIHSARYVTKTHTTNVATFRTPTFGPIGIVSKSNVRFFQKIVFEETYPINSISKKVALLKAYTGMDSILFEALVESNIDGLVIEALGAGNMPPETLPGIKKLLDKGIPIVITSRAFNGIAQDIYAYKGGGKHLKGLGAIYAPGLTGVKARIKLHVLLENNISLEDLNEIFES